MSAPPHQRKTIRKANGEQSATSASRKKEQGTPQADTSCDSLHKNEETKSEDPNSRKVRGTILPGKKKGLNGAAQQKHDGPDVDTESGNVVSKEETAAKTSESSLEQVQSFADGKDTKLSLPSYHKLRDQLKPDLKQRVEERLGSMLLIYQVIRCDPSQALRGLVSEALLIFALQHNKFTLSGYPYKGGPATTQKSSSRRWEFVRTERTCEKTKFTGPARGRKSNNAIWYSEHQKQLDLLDRVLRCLQQKDHSKTLEIAKRTGQLLTEGIQELIKCKKELEEKLQKLMEGQVMSIKKVPGRKKILSMIEEHKKKEGELEKKFSDIMESYLDTDTLRKMAEACCDKFKEYKELLTKIIEMAAEVQWLNEDNKKIEQFINKLKMLIKNDSGEVMIVPENDNNPDWDLLLIQRESGRTGALSPWLLFVQVTVASSHSLTDRMARTVQAINSANSSLQGYNCAFCVVIPGSQRNDTVAKFCFKDDYSSHVQTLQAAKCHIFVGDIPELIELIGCEAATWFD